MSQLNTQGSPSPNPKKKSSRTAVLVKAFLGAGLVVYVLRSKMVDFDAVRAVIWEPGNVLRAMALLTLSMLCCATRWFLLARAQKLSLSFQAMIELTMIGNFFNTFMPGSVGGDLIKAWYVAGREPQRKTRAIFTVLLDRIIGLSVIVFCAASTIAFFSDWLPQNPQLQLLAYSIWGFTGASALGIGLFFLSRVWKSRLSASIKAFVLRTQIGGNIFEALSLYRNHIPTIFISLALSAVSVFGTCLLFMSIGDRLGIAMDLGHYLFVVPIALTVSAIPLLPGGIGVGQVAFHTLFLWTGVANPDMGATLCTVMQIYIIAFNCLGAFFYLRFRRKPAMDAAPETSASHPIKIPHALSTQLLPEVPT